MAASITLDIRKHRGVSVTQNLVDFGQQSGGQGYRPAGLAFLHRTTEVVYRRELRPVITTGAEIMDEIIAGG